MIQNKLNQIRNQAEDYIETRVADYYEADQDCSIDQRANIVENLDIYVRGMNRMMSIVAKEVHLEVKPFPKPSEYLTLDPAKTL
jgi:hypothetical protein